jgi:hypothetical protein
MAPETRKQILPTILRALIPASLIYVGRDDSFWVIFPALSHEHVPAWKLGAFVIGTLWAALITPLQLAAAKVNLSKLQKQGVGFKADKVQAHITTVLRRVGCRNHKLHVRCFKYQPAFRNYLGIPKFRKGYLKPMNIEGITTPLKYVDSFEAHPRPEGVVGEVFRTGKRLTIWNTEDGDLFPLHEQNRNLVDNVKFISAFPLRSRKPQDRGKIIAVLSVDCEKPLVLNDNKKLQVNTFVDTIGDFVENQLHHEQGKND